MPNKPVICSIVLYYEVESHITENVTKQLDLSSTFRDSSTGACIVCILQIWSISWVLRVPFHNKLMCMFVWGIG